MNDLSIGIGISESPPFMQLSKYNPLINYKWTTETPSEYVTDGVELVDLTTWTQSGIDIDNTITVYSANSFSMVQANSNTIAKLEETILLTIGETYLIRCDVVNNSGYLKFDIGAVSITLEDNIIFVADKTKLSFYRGGVPSNVDVTNFSVQKVIQEPNKRYFIDSGVAPKYPALMASGSGVKFNGVDMSIDTLATLSLADGSAISVSFDFEYIDLNDKYIFTSKYNGLQVRLKSLGSMYISATYTGTNLAYTIPTGTFTAGEQYNLAIALSSNSVAIYINGVLHETIDTVSGDVSYLSEFVFGAKNDLSGGFYSGMVNNAQIHNSILTPTQIQYQYNNPERFLYREDNVLKSEILTQSEIDNVVAFLPMNEVGDTVYDLAQEPPVGYPISNYTNSCRDEAINLVYGRQNALLKRDSLGVEYASSFDSMELDGENRLNLPMTDTELGNKFVIDFVISREQLKSFRTYLLYSRLSAAGISIQSNESNVNSILYLTLYGTSTAQVSASIGSDFHHIIFENNGTNLTMIVDGVAGTPVAHSFVPSGLKFSDSTQAPPTGSLPHFQVWTEANYDKYDRAKSIANGADVVAQFQGV